jgi:hypothetical protein
MALPNGLTYTALRARKPRLSGAHVAMHSISWHMQRSETDDAFVPESMVRWYDERSGHCVPLTTAQWVHVVHPQSDWMITYQFDDRAAGHDESIEHLLYLNEHVKIAEFIPFKHDATVRDVLTAIAALPHRYGYFEGLREVEPWGT